MAALPLAASRLIRTLPSSTPGAAFQPVGDVAPQAAGAPGAGQFPELFAGLFSAIAGLEGDASGNAPDGAPAPGPDVPAGIETLLGGTRTSLHGNATAGTRPAGARAKGSESGPDAEQAEAAQKNPALVPDSVGVSPAAAGLPAAQQPLALSPQNGDAAVTPGGEFQGITEKSPVMDRQARLALLEPDMTPCTLSQPARPATAVTLPPCAGVEGVAAAGSNPDSPAEPVPSSGGEGARAEGNAIVLKQAPPQVFIPGVPVPAADVGPAPSLQSSDGAVRQNGALCAETVSARPPGQVAVSWQAARDTAAPVGESRQEAPAADPVAAAATATGGGASPSPPKPHALTSSPARPEAETAGAPGAAAKTAAATLAQPAAAAPTEVPTSREAIAAAAAGAWHRSVNANVADSSFLKAAREQVSTAGSRRTSGNAVARVLALSGQATRTVESSPTAGPPAQPVAGIAWTHPQTDPQTGPRPAAHPGASVDEEARTAPESPAVISVSAADPLVQAPDTAASDGNHIAFAVQMKAGGATENTVPQSPPGQTMQLAEAGAAPRIAVQTPAHDVVAPASPAESENRPSPLREAEEAPARAAREHRPEVGPAQHAATPAGAPEGRLVPHAFADALVKAETEPDSPDAAPAKPVRPQDVLDSGTAPDAARTPLVRDMRLEVTGGEQRVEVRVTERGGEVKMTVRTPDTQLAGTLRENLPTLSARLADSGFRSDAWHPAGANSSQGRHTAESSAGGASQDAGTPSRQQDRQPQDGAGQRRPRIPQETALPKEKGKEFAWLMSTIR